ncbi:MAG: hypothetical protein KKA97_13035 [Actinobacteria bacterium]|jgi:Mce-associated membrane protein|nr:hypothetical protein [Actinomycetota bacterium]
MSRLSTGARLETVLYVVALLLACGCVVGGVVIVQQARGDARTERESPQTVAPSAAEQERYGEALRAAESTALALVNIDYEDPEASFEAVRGTATGTFLEQYDASSESLVDLVTQFESVLTGTVVSSAVSSIDQDDATVLVATDGTVSNAQTGEGGQARNFRILVKLVREGDRWLTNDLEFVG